MASDNSLVPNSDSKEDADPATVWLYQSTIGSLMYIMLGTQPDLTFAVQKLSSFSANPSVNHCHTIARLFGYLNWTKHTTLVY